MPTRAVLAALATVTLTAFSFTPLGSEAATGGPLVVDTIPRDPALLGDLQQTRGTRRDGAWLAGAEPSVAMTGDRERRALVTFDIGGIPSGATIVSALLTLDQCAATPAAMPAATRADGRVIVDHLAPVTAPDAATFDVQPVGMAGAFDSDGPLGARRVSVTAAVTADFATLQTLTQYRLRLDAPGGAVTFRGDADGECAAASDAAPVLVVTYRR